MTVILTFTDVYTRSGHRVGGKAIPEHTPAWFKKQVDEWEGGVLHTYNNEYWSAKDKQSWQRCPNIF